MNKIIIAPIVAFLIVAIKLIFGVEIPDEVGGEVTNGVVNGVTLAVVIIGIFKNHKKETP